MFELAFTIVGTAIAVFVVILLLWLAYCCVIAIAAGVMAIVSFIADNAIVSFCVIVFAMLMAYGVIKANAQQHLPPLEYDKPYPGKLTIEEVTLAQLLATCSTAYASSLGCAFPGKDRCHIKLLSEASIQAAGWTVELMLRHERAHCNGWPGDHPGKRPYQSNEGMWR